MNHKISLKGIPIHTKCDSIRTSNALNEKKGNLIDEFDIIIRLNNFRTSGYQEYVGSKTSFALISPACMPSEELSKMNPKDIFVVGGNLRKDYEKIRNRLLDETRGCNVLPPEENLLSPSIYNDGLRIEMGFDITKAQWPSTGTVAIQWARDRYGKAAKVFIHGFDFYESNQVTLERYFGVETKADGKHNFDKEKIYVSAMLTKGLIHNI